MPGRGMYTLNMPPDTSRISSRPDRSTLLLCRIGSTFPPLSQLALFPLHPL